MDERIYLDTYLLQQDMRVRLPKSVITNLVAEKGKTKFDIYLDSKEHCLIFKIQDDLMSEYEENIYSLFPVYRSRWHGCRLCTTRD